MRILGCTVAGNLECCHVNFQSTTITDKKVGVKVSVFVAELLVWLGEHCYPPEHTVQGHADDPTLILLRTPMHNGKSSTPEQKQRNIARFTEKTYQYKILHIARDTSRTIQKHKHPCTLLAAHVQKHSITLCIVRFELIRFNLRPSLTTSEKFNHKKLLTNQHQCIP